MSKHQSGSRRERRALLAGASLQATGLAAQRRGQGRLRDLRLGPQGRDAEPRADRAGDPGAAEDAPPRRQRRRRGGRLRPAARHPAQDLGRGGALRRPRPLADPRRRLRRRPRLRRALPGPGEGPARRPRAARPKAASASSPSGSAWSTRPRWARPRARRSRTSGSSAGLVADAARRDRVLFDLLIELERRLGVHVPSFSATTCVYKVMGTPNVLGEYYPDLRDERFETIGCFGHNRYSTNTWPSFKRVQPFSVLGHNGEINTIEQLRQEARMLARADPAGLLRLAGPQPHDRHPGQPRRASAWPRRWRWSCRRSSRRSARCPRTCTASTCTCTRRWGRSPRGRSR